MRIKLGDLRELIREAVKPLVIGDRKSKSRATPEFLARVEEWRSQIFPIYKKVKANPQFATSLAKAQENAAFKDRGAAIFGRSLFSQMCFDWVNQRGVVNKSLKLNWSVDLTGMALISGFRIC